jgi:hypothetical protein
VESAVSARCPICGQALWGDPVYCQRCNTPHHVDCWRFAGQCAIYACGSQLAANSITESLQVELTAIEPVSTLPHVRKEISAAEEMHQNKRQAFRHWLRELLTESISPFGAKRAGSEILPPVHGRTGRLNFRYRDKYFEEVHAWARLIFAIQLCLLPFVLVIVAIAVGLSWSTLSQALVYLCLPLLLLIPRAEGHSLIVDRKTGKILVVARAGLIWKRHHISDRTNVIHVGIWQETGEDVAGETCWTSTIFLFDVQGRRVPVLGGKECVRYDPDVPEDLVLDARSLAAFLDVPYRGIFTKAPAVTG